MATSNTLIVRIPTRQFTINDFTKEQSEKIFDLCSKKKCIHIKLDNEIFMNNNIRYMDVMKIRKPKYIHTVIVIENKSKYRKMEKQEINNKDFLDSISHCLLFVSEFSNLAYLFIIVNASIEEDLETVMNHVNIKFT